MKRLEPRPDAVEALAPELVRLQQARAAMEFEQDVDFAWALPHLGALAEAYERLRAALSEFPEPSAQDDAQQIDFREHQTARLSVMQASCELIAQALRRQGVGPAVFEAMAVGLASAKTGHGRGWRRLAPIQPPSQAKAVSTVSREALVVALVDAFGGREAQVYDHLGVFGAARERLRTRVHNIRSRGIGGSLMTQLVGDWKVRVLEMEQEGLDPLVLIDMEGFAPGANGPWPEPPEDMADGTQAEPGLGVITGAPAVST